MDYLNFDNNILPDMLNCESTKCKAEKEYYEQCLKQGHTNCKKWLLQYYKCIFLKK